MMTFALHSRVWVMLLLTFSTWVTLPVSLLAAEKKEKNAPSEGDSSEIFFTNGLVPRLKIEIVGTNLTTLQADNRRYVRATVREGSIVYRDVGIHLKGAAGSFSPLEDRPALTLNFDKFVNDQKFHSLDKLHLNNSVQDPSYLCEELCGALFLQAGVPAPRATHARVELNGRDLGLYVLKEGFDKSFLRRHFSKAKGNLYDGGFLREINESLERTSGEGLNDRGDLKALAAAASESDQTLRWQRLNRLLDVDRFISFVALEMFTWHWDGYALKKNNYRIYHDPASDKMVFLPHGMDQMFWAPNGPIQPSFEGLVARALMATPEGRQRYRQRCAEIYTNIFQMDQINERINQIQARIRPVLSDLDPDQVRRHDEAVTHLRRQISQRASSIARQLSLPGPAPIKFDPTGIASLQSSHWYSQSDRGGSVVREAKSEDGRSVLQIIATDGQPSVGSWRTRLELPPGRYRFEATVRTKEVLPLTDGGHRGAGLRISGDRQSRRNLVIGTADWQVLSYDFTVDETDQGTVLICELRATKGETSFDRSKMRLIRAER